MKLKDNFIVHDTGGQTVMVSTGSDGFNGLIRANKTAAFILECLKEETTEEAVATKISEKYGVSRDIASSDVKKIVGRLREIGAIGD